MDRNEASFITTANPLPDLFHSKSFEDLEVVNQKDHDISVIRYDREVLDSIHCCPVQVPYQALVSLLNVTFQIVNFRFVMFICIRKE